MKKCCIFILLACLIASINGRCVSPDPDEDDHSRTLKGVLKYYKDQPRVTDSESLEFEEVNNDNNNNIEAHKLDSQAVQNEVQQSILKTNNVPSSTTENKIVEVESETTLSPSLPEVPESENVSSMPKSDLHSDDILDDVDEDGCIEGDVMKVSCNTCVCSEGKFFCSKRNCHEKQTPLPPLTKPSHKRKGAPIKYHSVKGETSKQPESSANVQTDAADDDEGNEIPKNSANRTTVADAVDSSQCIDGRTKPVDCNQCVCALGKWACTKASCIALSLREKASYSGNEFLKSVGTLKEYMNIDEDCLEGEAKQVGCNQCVCSRNSWACSDFTCPSTPEPPKKENILEACQTEEDVKSKDCNICSCRRGVWVCSKNDCKKFGNRYFNPVSHSHKHYSNENDQDK